MAMNVRRATVLTADGRKLRNVSALWLDDDNAEVRLTVTDRTGAEVYTAEVFTVQRARGSWTFETDEGTVIVRRGCGCGK